MNLTPAARETKPTPADLSPRFPDGPELRIPAGAFTPHGFRKWVDSGGCPPGLRADFLGQAIRIEMEEADVSFLVPSSAATLEGFCQWAASEEPAEWGRIAFLDPEIVIDMNGEDLEAHVKLKLAVTLGLGPLVEELDIGEFLPDGVLVTNVRAAVSNVPDASFIRWDTSESGRVELITRRAGRNKVSEVRGAPDWVMEVVSDSSVKKDTRDLRIRYRRAGIPEYWLIDARGAEIDFQMLVLRGNRYTAIRPRDGWYSSPVFGRAFRLERRSNRAGRWQYKLHVRPA